MTAAMRVGSPEHVALFCDVFLNSHLTFAPAQLEWPVLSPAELALLRGIPFWQEVLHTEMRAISIIEAYLATVSEPRIREAIALMAYEEHRHERLVRHLIGHYGIQISELAIPPVADEAEIAFIEFGFGECVDSFLGFGFFNLAQQARLFPAPLFAIFDCLLYEEMRHVLLIVNWMAWRECGKGRHSALRRSLTSGWYYARAIAALLGTAQRNAHDQGDGQSFSATQAGDFLDGFSVRRLLEECLAENQRRLAGYDPHLLRPQLLPNAAGLALALMRPWRPRPQSR